MAVHETFICLQRGWFPVSRLTGRPKYFWTAKVVAFHTARQVLTMAAGIYDIQIRAEALAL